jgi:hypothetical protein
VTFALAALLALLQVNDANLAPDAGVRPDAGTRADADADGGTARPSPEQATAQLAKKAVDLANIHLQAGRLYTLGLFLLARKPTTEWDRAHSLTLFNQAENAVTDADRSLAELSGMARGEWSKAADPLAHARATIVQVHKDLRAISVPPEPRTAAPDPQQIARKAFEALDSARKNLDQAAGVMKVDTKLRAP